MPENDSKYTNTKTLKYEKNKAKYEELITKVSSIRFIKFVEIDLAWAGEIEGEITTQIPMSAPEGDRIEWMKKNLAQHGVRGEMYLSIGTNNLYWPYPKGYIDLGDSYAWVEDLRKQGVNYFSFTWLDENRDLLVHPEEGYYVFRLRVR